jgi:hypothetical protein
MLFDLSDCALIEVAGCNAQPNHASVLQCRQGFVMDVRHARIRPFAHTGLPAVASAETGRHTTTVRN